MSDETVLISSVAVFKGKGRSKRWFLVGDSEGKWELPKMLVKKVESSVKASIRMMEEKASTAIQVFEEAGRVGGTIKIGNKVAPQRIIYYVAIERLAGKVVGFEKYTWLTYAKAARKISAKREQTIFREARKLADQAEKDERTLPPEE